MKARAASLHELIQNSFDSFITLNNNDTMFIFCTDEVEPSPNHGIHSPNRWL